MTPVSVTLTTFNRLDLLLQTKQSFEQYNDYPINNFYIINDNPANFSEIDAIFSDPKYTVIHNMENIGQKKSLDILFNMCEDEYIFHLEDDWMFDNSSEFIANSIKILENDKTIHQIWVRHEYDNPHKSIGDVISIDGAKYKVIDPDFRGCWNGYSWNPGLRRKSDYLKMFPEGVVAHFDEMACAAHTKTHNYKCVLLQPTVCYHIGYNRSTQ